MSKTHLEPRINVAVPAVVRAHKKYAFTVTPITDIEAYRAERKAFEEQWEREYAKRQAERRGRAMEGVAEQNLELTFTELEQAEIAYRKTRDDEYLYEGYKPKHTPGNWDAENLAEKARLEAMWETEEPKVPFWQRVKNSIINFFSLAFEK